MRRLACVTYVDIKYMHFCVMHICVFENSRKLESVINSVVFCIKISCQSKEFPLSKKFPPLVQTHPF